MSLLVHMIRTDLRRLRWPLVGWFVLLATTPALGWLLLGTDAGVGRWFATIVMWRYGLLFVEFLVGIMLVPLVIHGDPVVGDSAFWMSRPISPARLWWSKVGTLAAIFGLLPVLVLLPWWLYCGYGVTEIALAIMETLAWQAVIVALALPVATLTSAFMRFALWLLVVVTAMLASSVFWLVTPEYLARTAYDLTYLWTRAWLALGVFLIGGVAVAAWQYRTRRFSHSAVLFAFVFTLAVATLGYWPRRFTPAPTPDVDVIAGPRGEQIRLSFDTAQVLRVNAQHSDLQVSLRFNGVPADRILSEVWDISHEGRMPAEHVWTWGSGLRLGRTGWLSQGSQARQAEWVAMGLPNPPPDPAVAIASLNERRRKAGLAPIFRPTDGRWGELRVQVPRAFPTRVQTEPPAYHVRVHLDLIRPTLAGECPLEVGQTLRIGSTIARVKAVNFDRHQSNQMPLLIESVPMLLAQGGLWNLVPMLRAGQIRPHRYYIVNRARGNASDRDNGGIGARFGSVQISRRELSKAAPWGWRDGEWVQQQDWFRGLTLAAIAHEREERFFKEVSVEHFTVVQDAGTRGAP